MRLSVIAVCLALVAGAYEVGAAPLNLYVSPQGNDAWTGSRPGPNGQKSDGPFATLERARDELRRLKQQRGELREGAVVWLRGGFHAREKSFELGREDSGTLAAPIVYRAWENEKPIFAGGVEIANWKTYRGNIVQADVSNLGLETLTPLTQDRFQGDVPAFEMFFAGRRLDLARWPNHIANHKRDGEWSYIAAAPEKSRTQFSIYGERAKNWAKPQELQVHVWPQHDWFDQFVGVKSIDADKGEITLAQPTGYDLSAGRRFYVRNVREELDAPGEWYFDRENKVLLLYPPQPLKNGKVFVSMAPNFVNAKGTSDVTFRGLTIDGYRGTGVIVENGARVRIEGCTIRNTFATGISFSGGSEHTAIGNDIYEIGRGGITMNGGDRETLTHARHLAENNHIHHFGRVLKCYQTGIQVGGVGTTVRHNLIHDGPHMGLGSSGNDHLMEFNHLHHLCMEGSDNGAFYTGRDWTFRGSALRYNMIHDVIGYGFDKVDLQKGVIRYSSPHAAQGIYLDDAVGGFHIFGNVLYRIGDMMIQLGGGRDNIIENNIFAGGNPAIGTDARWAAYDWQGHMFPRLQAVPYQTPPWSTRYPELVKPMRNYKWPEGNRFVRNISAALEPRPNGFTAFRHIIPPDATISEGNLVWNPNGPVTMNIQWLREGEKNNYKSLPWAEWQAAGFDKNGLVADPLFVDPQNDNYQLKPNSPAYKVGFQRIPMEKIGLYKDELRASWPVNKNLRKENLAKVYEDIPIPGWTPPARVQSTLNATRTAKAPQLDGTISPDEWGAITASIEQAFSGTKAMPTSSAWLRYDDKYLYVAFANTVSQSPTTGNNWGEDDAVEIALRNRADGNVVLGNPMPGKDAPIVVLRGFPNGKWLSSDESGAPASAIARAQQGTSYAAKIVDAAVWTAEWRIAWDALGFNPANQSTLDANLTVRKPASDLWLMWRGTNGNSFNVDNAGQLVLAK
ncbi:MAG: hypothetical protein JWN98_698 [Abditibacteriota bacterium]|nr:hypothetical protein [Abditibacteriota bacterium]